MKISKEVFIVFAILLVSAFFRFYNFFNFQVWTGDDETLAASIRHIVWDRSPLLLIPNTFLEFGLGPFYYYFLSVFFFLTNFNLVLVQSVASVIGFITTYIIYLCGKSLKNGQVGLIAAFIYATSFFAAVFDRRVWPLNPGPFLSALTVFCIIKIIKRDYRFIALLAVPLGFVFHTDLSMFILIMGTTVIWVVYKFPLMNKYVAVFFVILGIFASTFVLAEFKYNHAVSGPILKSITRPLRGETITSAKVYSTFGVFDVADVLTGIFFTNQTKSIESLLCHGSCLRQTLPLSPFSQIILTALFLTSFYRTFKKPRRSDLKTVLWIMGGSFILGLFVYNRVFHANFSAHYFLVIIPVLILIAAENLDFFLKRRLFLYFILFIYFSFNTLALFNSSAKYPLYEKISLVQKSSPHLTGQKFAIRSSPDGEIQGGGWTELFVLNGTAPVKSYWYDFGEWMYQAYSLTPVPLQKEDPSKIVLIQKEYEDLDKNENVIRRFNYKDIELIVIENSEPKKF